MVRFGKTLLVQLAVMILAVAYAPLAAQDGGIKISGTVIDKEAEAIPGVSVVLKGTSIGYTTNAEGSFEINVPNKQSVLVFSFVGFKTQEVIVGNQRNLTIRLEEESESLDAVVVTGYGKQKRISIVGSISTIEPKQLKIGTTRSVANNLAGQLAGIIAIRPSGEPGYDDSQFWIRGISSFGGGNKRPMVLVDGIERNLNDIDAAEIESFSILKDASASAMYGVRGANGVIIINTKRGSVAPPSIDFRIEQSIEQPTKLPQFLNATDYMTLINKLALEDGRPSLPFDPVRITRTASREDLDLYPDVNWLDAVTQDYAYNTRANLHVSGGNPILRYSLVAAYFNERGIMAVDEANPYDTGTGLNRYNLRANVDLDVTRTTLFRFNIGGYLQFFRKQAWSTDNIFSGAFALPPYMFPTRYSDGRIPKTALGENPWAVTTQVGYDKAVSSKLESLFSVEQNLKMITPGLKARLTFSFDTWTSSSLRRAKTPTYYPVAMGRDADGNLIHGDALNEGSEFLGNNSGGDYGNNNVYFEAMLTYDKTFAEKHDVNALFLYNQRSYDDGGIQPYRTQGIAGRLSYTYDRRYIGEINFGYNGSENFAKGHRYGFFPSVALGWVLSEEQFMEPYKHVLNKIKFRGSMGKLGNQDIGGNRRFAYLTTINANAGEYWYGYTGQFRRQGVREGAVGIPDLTWESVTKSNLGFELGLWNTFDFQIDFFKERRSEIFMQRQTIPAQAGFLEIPYANYGIVDNKGFDMQLTFNRQFGEIFVGFRGSFTYAKNNIVEIDEPAAVIAREYRSATGKSINTLTGLWAERLYTINDFDSFGNLKDGIPTPELGMAVRPGDIKYVDKDKDNKITANDAGFIGGTETPEIVYGFGATLSYKNFDLGFFFQGAAEMYRVINSNDLIPGNWQGTQFNIYDNYADAWSYENPSQHVFYPRLSYGQNTNNAQPSTWWKKNMSFLRLRNLELGYSLPEQITARMKLKTIRFYINGNNLFYFSGFKLWDPELGTNNGFKYPPMRSVLLGLNLRF